VATKRKSKRDAKARAAPDPDDGDEAGRKYAARNRRARFRYSLQERFEAGISLLGNEVKSLRESGAALDDAYARFQGGELYLVGAKITPYEKGRPEDQETARSRRLLMHRRELKRLESKLAGSGLTVVPLSIYFRRGWAKVELALAGGKGGRDRREDIKRRDQEREMGRALKRGGGGRKGRFARGSGRGE